MPSSATSPTETGSSTASTWPSSSNCSNRPSDTAARRPPRLRAGGLAGAPPTASPRGGAVRTVAEALGYLGGPVGEDDLGAGSLDRGERLHDDAVAIDPAVRGGRLDHRVLAG